MEILKEDNIKKKLQKKRKRNEMEGNLSFSTTKDDIIKHFRCINTCGKIIDVRMLIQKETGNFRGAAFIEFNNNLALQKALKLHHSVLKGRKINIELTSGGSGNSEYRRKKIKEKNEKLKKERKKYFEIFQKKN